MPYYDRLFSIAVLFCLAAGVLCVADADAAAGMPDFVAVALGIRLDDGLRRRCSLLDERPTGRWERRRTPV